MKPIDLKAFFCLLLLMSTLALAHSEQGIAGGFISGFTHPIFGWDHVAAMVAVGLWGAFLGMPAIVLGACIAAAIRPPLWAAAVLVAVFAIFHGHAHGTELPDAANPFAYAAGFVLGTGLMHLSGIAVGYLVRWSWGVKIVRGLGAFIAIAGVGFMSMILSA